MNEDNIYDKLKPDIYKRIKKSFKGKKNILDVGCGDCRLVNFLAEHNSNKVVGADISDIDFERADQQAVDFGVAHSVECKKIDVHKLSGFKDCIFDAAIMLYSLHEFDKPALVLKEVNRVLKDKGRILIVDFPKGSKAEELWGENYFKAKEIKFMLVQSNFKKLNIGFPYGENLLIFASGVKSDRNFLRIKGRKRIKEIEEQIKELKARWPAHSVPIQMFEMLDELEDELDKERKKMELL